MGVRSPRADELMHLLEFGVVRNLPYRGGVSQIIHSKDFYGITFQSRLLDIKKLWNEVKKQFIFLLLCMLSESISE